MNLLLGAAILLASFGAIGCLIACIDIFTRPREAVKLNLRGHHMADPVNVNLSVDTSFHIHPKAADGGDAPVTDIAWSVDRPEATVVGDGLIVAFHPTVAGVFVLSVAAHAASGAILTDSAQVTVIDDVTPPPVEAVSLNLAIGQA